MKTMNTNTFRSPRAACLAWAEILLLALLLLVPAAVVAQDEPEPEAGEEAEAEEPDEDLSFFASTSVTATGTEIDTFDIPAPVIVIDAERIEELQPDNAADLLRGEPGVDVNGIGPNQARPIIRGQRGLRILFLENGLRMNNARRQSDFGEATGLVDIDNVETLEVVRGPASVLYGSDAIGGVLNLITKVPTGGSKLGVSLGLRFSPADEQLKGNVGVSGNSDRWSYALGVTLRSTEAYEAPSGDFGDITLDNDTIVNDTGIDDDSVNAYFSYRPNDKHAVFFRLNRYRADETGFGFVDPPLIGDDSGTVVQILYPFQDFDRYTLGYQASGLQSALANTIDFQLYQQENERQLANNIFIDIGPIFGFGPSSDIEINSLNFSDLETTGFRGEITKIVGEKQVLTYGAEYYEDDSFNTDFSTTTQTFRAPFPFGPGCDFLGPPFFFFECAFVDTDDVANSPNATNTGLGVFIQDEIRAGDRFSATIGLRYAETETNAESTPGLDTTGQDFSDDAVVGAIDLTYSIKPTLNLVGSYATAFRAPNIIERLFNGLTPEGLGFQVLNPDLVSEESENVDIGLKYRSRRAFFEAIYFDTEIDDAIVQRTLTDDEIAQLPQATQDEIDQAGVSFVVQQRNADVLKVDGIEVAGGFRFDNGFSVGGNYTHLSGESESGGPAADPTGDTFSDKWNAHLRYDSPNYKYWLEYRVRHNGEEDADLDPAAVPGPLGEVLPSFTIHRLAAGLTIFEGDSQEHRLGVIIDNLSDELYAEFSNATFFRPQPERNFIFTYNMRFR
ncbi:MAG: TonB-dependent receptor [bacterium]|nr:TonB-dependent receptor [bacterium]